MVYSDKRGCFFESFNLKQFEEATGLSPNFVQDNQSKSVKGVMRGLHYQLPPKTQDKLVRVVHGEIYDIAVDIRKNSPTYRLWVAEILTAENRKQMWIPEGFAHGFLSLSDYAEVLYKTTDYYAPETEQQIIWNDPDIDIEWPFNCNIILSEKDCKGMLLKDSINCYPP